MRATDFDEFAALLADVWSLKGQVLTGGAKAMWFRALSAHPLPVVQAALDAHLCDPRRGQFLPMPADVIAQIEAAAADDGRPGPEEAWAIAIRSTDEADTIVWTPEIAEAFGIARPILAAGDEVGCRMAFKEAYSRLVDEAREARRPPEWVASLGRDPELRERALQSAAARGVLAASSLPQLPPPRGEVLLLTQKGQEGAPQAAREALLVLKQRLLERAAEPSADAQAKQDTEVRRLEMAERVAERFGPLE